MIIYRHKFFDALDDELEKMEREEREERKKLERERKKNIENRTKYNTFLSNYKNLGGTSWGRDTAKKKAKELDKLGYSDEDILLGSSSVFPLINDNTVKKGMKIGGISGLASGSAMLLSKKFRDKHKFLVKYPLGMAGIGGIIVGTVGAIGATKKRKEAVNDLLEQRRKDEEERRKK